MNDLEFILRLNQKIDQEYNLNQYEIESLVQDEYPDLHPDALNTSYSDYYQILESIPNGQTLVDLGAGLGRGSLLSCLLGTNNCYSVEIVRERHLQLRSALAAFDQEYLALQMDLRCGEIPKAENFYIYFPKGEVFYHILRELIKRKSNLYICEAHGDLIPFMELFSKTFRLVGEIPLHMPRHHPTINIYKTCGELFEEGFPSWYLKNFDSDIIITVKFNHLVLDREVLMFLPIRYFDLVNYSSRLGLQHRISNRRYILDNEIKIVSKLNLKLPKYMQDKLSHGFKVFCLDKKVFMEGLDGILIKTELSTRSLFAI